MSVKGLWSPDTGNLLIGKGILIFKRDDESAFYTIGNVPALSITPKVTNLDHFDSQTGTKTKDLTIVIEKTMEVKMDMEEATANNLALLMLGTIDRTNPNMPIVALFARASITGHLMFFAANDVGPRWFVDLPSITFNPSGDFSPITDGKFAVMSVTGSVNVQDGLWGTATLHGAVADDPPDNVLAPFITADSYVVGETYTAQVGGWIGVTTFAYQWKKGGTPISLATNKTYVPLIGDVGTNNITVTVTGTNANGSTGPVVSTAVSVAAY